MMIELNCCSGDKKPKGNGPEKKSGEQNEAIKIDDSDENSEAGSSNESSDSDDSESESGGKSGSHVIVTMVKAYSFNN